MKLKHKDLANAVRFLSLDAVEVANSGHPGMPMGMADVATVLFKNFRKLDCICAGHPEYHSNSGIETTTGPLGPVSYTHLTLPTILLV